MEKASEFCCIFLAPFATTTWKRKRKFHGASCENSKRILNKICVSQTRFPLSSYLEKSEKDVYLCHHCHSQADKIVKLKEEMLYIASHFSNKILALHKFDTPFNGAPPPDPVPVAREQ